MKRTGFAVVGGAALLTLGTIAQTHASAPAAHKITVKAATVKGNYAFSPTKKTIHVGTKVVWKNATAAPHTVTSKSSNWKVNKSFSPGKSVSITFKKAGTYKYYCTIHPWMKGTIVVKK